MSFGRAAVGLAAAALLTATAGAASLRTLHVDALSMRADRVHVAVGEVFHLAIHVRVRENVAALDELVVPDVGTMKLEGDERNVTSSPAGTDVVETLTLEPTVAGAFTFKGAYLDAIDARTRKPSRFSANPVRIVVDAPAPVSVAGVDAAWRLVLLAGLVAGGLALIGGGLVLVVALRRRAQPVVPVVAPVPPAPAPPPRTPRTDVEDALRAYRTAPGQAALTRLRGALFVAAGTNAGATLRDALAATSDGALRAALIAAERTAFGPAHERDAASAELVAATESWLSAALAGSSR
ncbi:MAG TPA: hypothetical protein VGU66_04595 [Candidatus Elarobacter sp.]|nr:hypothetical protein [Candidatus Elarobacter sp.]